MLKVTKEQADLLMGKVRLPVQLAPGARRNKVKPKEETGVTSACIDLLWAWGVFAWRNNSGGYLAKWRRKDGSEAKQFIKYGLKGSSDILGLTLKSGRFLAVETKTVNGELSDEQIEFRNRVEKHGGIYIVARNQEALVSQKAIILS